MKKLDFQEKIENRVRGVGQYILEHKTTLRETAKVFGVSKTTIHLDVIKRLGKHNPQLQEKVVAILQENKAVRNIHGGEATKRKYENLKKEVC